MKCQCGCKNAATIQLIGLNGSRLYMCDKHRPEWSNEASFSPPVFFDKSTKKYTSFYKIINL